MIYLIGGAPRSGKSTLAHFVTKKLNIGWTSTDLLVEVLKAKDVKGAPQTWDARPAAIKKTAEWFFPCLERYVWGAASMTEAYLIEGVAFLPEQVKMLAEKYPLRSVFLGCSQMDLEIFDRYPGHSRGYGDLPEEMRRKFAGDIPVWSEIIRRESARHGLAYVDMSGKFESGLQKAADLLKLGGSIPRDFSDENGRSACGAGGS